MIEVKAGNAGNSQSIAKFSSEEIKLFWTRTGRSCFDQRLPYNYSFSI